MPSNNLLRIPVFAWITLAAFLATVPMLFLGNAWGYDFDFHTSMWMGGEQGFRHGVLLPRWAAAAHGGYGEPSLILYPPLSWMTGGLLGLILPWKFAAPAYVFLALTLAGSAMWKLAAEWMEPPCALVAAVLYALNPYLLATIYKRSDFGEILSGALFPLLIWAAIRIARDGPRMIAPLTVIFASIWLADLPAGMIASYTLALLVGVESVLRRSLRPALLGSIAIVAAFAGMAFFLLPAAWERQWVEIGLVFRPDWVPENNFIFTPSIDPVMRQFSIAISGIAVLMVLLTALGAAFSGRLRRLQPNVWYLVAALGGASAFLLFRPSWILWQILPEFRYIEYPYRWLTPLATAEAFLVAAAIGETSRQRLFQVAAIAGTAAIGVAMLFAVRWDSQNRHVNEIVADERNGTGFHFTESKDWRLPLHSHPSSLPDPAPPVAPAGDPEGVRIDLGQLTPERKVFSVDSPRPVLLKIKLLNYPAWRAILNGSIVPLQTDPETGQMLLQVPSGFTHAEIVFTRTPDRTAGMIFSFVSILTLGLLEWNRRRRRSTADR